MIRADATGLKKSLCTGMGAQRPRGEYTAYAFRVLRRDGEEAPITVSRRRHRVRRISGTNASQAARGRRRQDISAGRQGRADWRRLLHLREASGNRKTCAVALHQVRREMTITR